MLNVPLSSQPREDSKGHPTRPALPARKCSPGSSVAERREHVNANACWAAAINTGDGRYEWALRPEISDMKESCSSAFVITEDVSGLGFSFRFKAGKKVQ